MQLAKRFTAAAIMAAALAATGSSAVAALLGPSPYASFSDSPFDPAEFDYFHLEDFDDHLLNTPGVVADGRSTAMEGFSGSVIDQVGLPGGCPPGGVTVACDTWFRTPASLGLQFVFNPLVLGTLPTAAGIVWTDGLNPIRFEAFDENNASLGSVTGNHADGSFFGTTQDDRFYGVTHQGGISRIVITSGASGGIEVDHLQYGSRAAPGAVSEPQVLALFGVALAGLALGRRRRRSSAAD